MVTVSAGNIPLPAKCSAQLKRVLQDHSVNMPLPPQILDNLEKQFPDSQQQDCSKDNIEKQTSEKQSHKQAIEKTSGSVSSENTPVLSPTSSFPPYSNSNDSRPIYPHLPFSPYGSPSTSPRVRRRPLRETTRVNSINDQSGDYVQLNQYKLEGAIGQVSYG